jgi:hypothetical protein
MKETLERALTLETVYVAICALTLVASVYLAHS